MGLREENFVGVARVVTLIGFKYGILGGRGGGVKALIRELRV